jgi:threonine dehydratase
MARFPLLSDVLTARRRLRGVALHTPLEASPALADEGGAAEVRLKLECLQPTGAFKIRGAYNKVALIAVETPDARLVTASTGNHGIAVASAAARYGMRLTVLVPASARPPSWNGCARWSRTAAWSRSSAASTTTSRSRRGGGTTRASPPTSSRTATRT